MSATLAALYRVVLRHRGAVLLLHLLVLGFAVQHAATVEIDYDIEDVFPASDPDRVVYEAYKQVFPNEDRVVAALVELDGTLDEADVRSIDQAAAALADLGLEDVTWFGSLEVGAGLNRRALLDRSKPLPPQLERLAGTPWLDGVFFDDAQRIFTLYGTLPDALNHADARVGLTRSLDDALGAQSTDARQWTVTGLPVIRGRALALIQQDMALFLGGGVFIMGLVLWRTFRSVGHALLGLAAVIPAYVVTVGIMGATGTHMSLLTSFMPVVVLVVGVCDTIHVLVAVRRQTTGASDVPGAISDAMAEMLVPCAVTSLTTAIGFLCLTTTGIDIVSEFGQFTALAVALAWVYLVTLLPVLLSFAPSTPEHMVTGGRRLLNHAIASARSPGPLPVVTAIVLVAVSLFAGRNVQTDAYLVDDIDPAHPVVADMRFAEEAGFAVFQANVWLTTEPEALAEPVMLQWMAELQGWLEGQGPVTKTLSLADLVTTSSGLPDTAATARARLNALGDDAVSSLAHLDRGEAQVLVTVRDVGSLEARPFIQGLKDRLATQPPPSGRALLTGTPVLSDNVYKTVVQGFAGSLGIAIAVIFGILIALFRSVRHAALAMVPNLLPLVVLWGCLGVFGWSLKPSTMLVFSVAFGIAVDDTLHLLGRIRALEQQGVDPRLALHRGMRDTGQALLVTTGVLAIGFSLLLGSRFAMLTMMGAMSIISAVVALWADLYLYPVLLTWASPALQAPTAPRQARIPQAA